MRCGTKTFVFVLLALVPLVCIPAAYADSGTAEVTVTVKPYWWGGCDCPTSVSITRVSDYEVSIGWTPGAANATSTVVRGKFDGAVSNVTDGFDIYQGTGASVTHWTVAETYGHDIHYSLYSNCTDGNISTCYASGALLGGLTLEEIATALSGLSTQVGNIWGLMAFGLQLAFPGILFLVWMRWRSLVVALALMFAIWLSLDVYFEQGLQYAYPMIMLGIGTILMLIFDLFGRRIIRL
jgi:hypothetical protein